MVQKNQFFCAQLFETPMDHSTPGSPVLHYLPEFAQIHVHWVSDAIEPSHPLPAPSPFNFNLSQHQALFQWVGSSYQVAKVLEFHFRISPSNEYSELISFRIDWFDFLAVQRTLKSFLQHHISKASILWLSDFFVVQLTSVHEYWKTIVGQYGPLSAKWCLCFLIHCLGLS